MTLPIQEVGAGRSGLRAGWKVRIRISVSSLSWGSYLVPCASCIRGPSRPSFKKSFATFEVKRAMESAGRWALCCSRAKFAVFVGSGRPELTWAVVSGQAGQGEIAFGFYVENGYEELPPDKTMNPFSKEGIDHSFFLRGPEWDWNRFRNSILHSSVGRRLVTDIMRRWNRPLVLRLDAADPDGAPSARRYWFKADQLCCKDEGWSTNRVRATDEANMWDWICDRADHRTAWFNVMLLEFTQHARGRVEPDSMDRVRLLLDAVLPVLRLCWGH